MPVLKPGAVSLGDGKACLTTGTALDDSLYASGMMRRGRQSARKEEHVGPCDSEVRQSIND
jgi:hypothetical protein